MKLFREEKKWVTDFENLRQNLEDLEVLMEFEKAGEIKSAEVSSHYAALVEDFEGLEFKNMLSDEGYNLSAVLQITCRCRWN